MKYIKQQVIVFTQKSKKTTNQIYENIATSNGIKNKINIDESKFIRFRDNSVFKIKSPQSQHNFPIKEFNIISYQKPNKNLPIINIDNNSPFHLLRHQQAFELDHDYKNNILYT